MNRAIPLVIMVVGLGLAASFGARNGADHQAYRAALWASENAEGAAATEAKAVIEAGVPAPRTRISQWASTGGLGWGLGIVLILGGAILARRQQAADFAGGDEEGGGIADFPGTVARIRAMIPDLEARLEGLPEDDTAPAVREALDGVRTDLFEPLVDARGQLMARHGIATFAEYFGPFSSAERQLNRTWSALTDGYVPTAQEALADARGSLDQAMAAWDKAEQKL